MYTPLTPPPPLFRLHVCRVPRTPDPSGVSIVLLASELDRIQRASSVLSLQQRRDTEDERKRERELKQVSCRDCPTPTPCCVLSVCYSELLQCHGSPLWLPISAPSETLPSPPLPSSPHPSHPLLSPLLPTPLIPSSLLPSPWYRRLLHGGRRRWRSGN